MYFHQFVEALCEVNLQYSVGNDRIYFIIWLIKIDSRPTPVLHQRGKALPGVCLSVCLLQLNAETADRIFTKMFS